MTSLHAPRVDPGAFAAKQKLRRERATAIKAERANAVDDSSELTFQPQLSNRHYKTANAVIKPAESQVREQMHTEDPFEKPLPATLKRLGMHALAESTAVVDVENAPVNTGAIEAPTDALGAAMKGAAAPRSPLKQAKSGKKGLSDPASSSAAAAAATPVAADEGVYVPASPTDLGMHRQRPISQAEADAAFATSLRPESDDTTSTTATAGGYRYNIDAIAPAFISPAHVASHTGKGSTPLRQTPGSSSRVRSTTPGSGTSKVSKSKDAGVCPAGQFVTPQKKPRPGSISTGSSSGGASHVTPSRIPTPTSATGAAVVATGSVGSSGRARRPTPRKSPAAVADVTPDGRSRIPSAQKERRRRSPRAVDDDAAATAAAPTAAAAASLANLDDHDQELQPHKAEVSPLANPKTRLSLLKKRISRRSVSRDRGGRTGSAPAADATAGLGVTDSPETAAVTTAAGMHRSTSAAVMATQQPPPQPSVMDSNGNLVLNGEYSGPGALAAPPRSAPVLRGRRPRPREPVVQRCTRADNEAFDPVTGEVRRSALDKRPTPIRARQSFEKHQKDSQEWLDAQQQLQKEQDEQEAAVTAVPSNPSTSDAATTAFAASSSAPAAASLKQDTSEHLVSFDNAANMPGAFADSTTDTEATTECPSCNRRFRAAAAERHLKVCKAVFVDKPKNPFDASKMRIEKLAEAAPELKYLLEGKASTAKHEPNGASSAKAKRNKWKQESNQLRQALNNTKKGNSTKGKVVGAPPTNATAEVVPENTPVTIASGSGSDDASDVGFPVETAADGLTPCPHCNRRFNERAHERHVPQCLNIRAKPRALKKNTGKMAVATALPPKTKGKVTRML